jgi:prepilin-type N-terminal cleavage/methylation domain-containing protein
MNLFLFKKEGRYMKKRFTLIELIVVIAIVAILASIVVPNIKNEIIG